MSDRLQQNDSMAEVLESSLGYRFSFEDCQEFVSRFGSRLISNIKDDKHLNFIEVEMVADIATNESLLAMNVAAAENGDKTKAEVAGFRRSFEQLQEKLSHITETSNLIKGI